MAQRREIAAVYAAAVVQGIVLVTFPAVSSIFTSRDQYGLSTTEYGGMFVPQAVTAILASLLGAGLTRRMSGKWVYLLGLGADLLAMVLLFVSQYATAEHGLAFGLLLAATASLGIGFGFVVPALNTFTAAFFPEKVDTAILTLNALLGLGTALAPVFAAIFVGLHVWWGLPLLMIACSVALLAFSLRLPLQDATGAAAPTPLHQGKPASIPARFWLYAAFALVYGVCETLNGNWSVVYLSTGLGASSTIASLGLTVFWVAVTGGRVLFAAIERQVPPSWTYRVLPLVIALAFLATAAVPRAQPGLALLSFGLAGLGCSALLPLVISFGQRELTTMAASVAGGLIGFYQMGYGIAAFGVGPLQVLGHLDLSQIYAGSAAVPIVLAILAFVIVGGRNVSPAHRAISPK
jgi:MFS family permease